MFGGCGEGMRRMVGGEGGYGAHPQCFPHSTRCCSCVVLPSSCSRKGAHSAMTASLQGLLPPERLRQLARAWLDEDIPSFDCGGAVVGEKPTVAHLYGKEAVGCHVRARWRAKHPR